MTAPPTTSEWPPRYLVVLWTTRSAPSSSGCWRYGEANVLSTASIAPCLWASSAMAAMSRICSSGLVGVSIQTSFVFGVMIVANPAGGGVVGVRGVQAPGLEDPFEQAEGAAVEVGGGGDFVAGPEQAANTAVVAARPEANARPRSPLFERGEARLQRRARRVAAARVLVALVLAGGGLRVGARWRRSARRSPRSPGRRPARRGSPRWRIRLRQCASIRSWVWKKIESLTRRRAIDPNPIP